MVLTQGVLFFSRERLGGLNERTAWIFIAAGFMGSIYLIVAIVRLYQQPQLSIWDAIRQAMMIPVLLPMAMLVAGYNIIVKMVWMGVLRDRFIEFLLMMYGLLAVVGLMFIGLGLFMPILVWRERRFGALFVHSFQKIWQELGFLLFLGLVFVGLMGVAVLLRMGLDYGFAGPLKSTTAALGAIGLLGLILIVFSYVVLVMRLYLIKVCNRSN